MSAEAIIKKIDRALEHLHALGDTIDRFFEQDAKAVYDLVGETNSQRTKHFFRAKLLKPLPLIEWGIVVGDAVHCLRTALDQLVYTFSTDPDDNTAFPIWRNRKEWVTRSPAQLWGVPEALVAAIDSSQPYQRGDAADAHPLAILSTLSNTDKHKFIPVTALIPEKAEWNITGTVGMASHGEINLKTGRPFEDRAVVAEMGFVPDNSGLEPDVEMHGNITFLIAFGKTGVPKALIGKPLMQAMAEIGEGVTEVLGNLDEAIGGFLAASS